MPEERIEFDVPSLETRRRRVLARTVILTGIFMAALCLVFLGITAGMSVR